MATPQEIRKIRLANDYKQMLNIQGDIISWTAVKGAPPHVEEYKLTINVRTIASASGDIPQYRDKSEVVVSLPADYPRLAPRASMVSPVIFHPNWSSGWGWCSGHWSMTEALGDFVIRMVKTLQFDPDITNPHGTGYSAADKWYSANLQKGIFPCDKTVLPDPSSSKEDSAPKTSGFVIKPRAASHFAPAAGGGFKIKAKA